MARFRLLDRNDKAPLLYRLMFSLDHFFELLNSEKVKLVSAISKNLPQQQIEGIIASVRKHMETPQAEIEALRTAEQLQKAREQQEYEEWLFRAANGETSESRGIAELAMLEAAKNN